MMTARLRKPAKQSAAARRGTVRVYSLEVFLLNGPISERFARKNRVVSRMILIRGDQTLQDLHYAIFAAFGRWEEHAYEFQFGKGPMDPEGPRYVLPGSFQLSVEEGEPAAGRVDRTTIDSLGLKEGDRFGYWFDFGDDWWHQVNVEAVAEKVPRGKYPRVTKRVGRSPPQYVDWDKEEA
jgi:hypothetical protein